MHSINIKNTFLSEHPIKRTIYALVFGATAASVTNPQRALDIATTGYYHTMGAVSQLISAIKSNTETKTMTEKVSESIATVTETIDEVPRPDVESIDAGPNAIGSDESQYTTIQTELKVAETREVVVNVKTDGKDVTREMEFNAQTGVKEVEGDIGQSNPDDADMYTTRS